MANCTPGWRTPQWWNPDLADMPEQSLEQVPPGFSSETCIWGLQISFFSHDNKIHCQKFWPINQINQQFHLIWFDCIISSSILVGKTHKKYFLLGFSYKKHFLWFLTQKTNQSAVPFDCIISFSILIEKILRSISLRKICNVMILPIVSVPPISDYSLCVRDISWAGVGHSLDWCSNPASNLCVISIPSIGNDMLLLNMCIFDEE